MADTLRLRLDPATLGTDEARAIIRRAAALWRAGATIAFPTETVYGLGANALDAAAVEKIFLAKQRPAWDPLIVHISDPGMLPRVAAEVPPRAQALIDAFWPGPLTLLLPKTAGIPAAVTAGRPLVGVRMPAHPAARALIVAAALPIAAPSANSFGRTSPTTAAHVLEDLDGRIDALIDGGPTTHGLESTVIDASQSPLVLYRPGAVTLEQLRSIAGEVILYTAHAEKAAPQSLPSPGVALRHYAPRAQLVLVPEGKDQRTALWHAAARLHQQGHRPGLMRPEGWREPSYDNALIFDWGRWDDPAQLAQRLFLGLRELDRQGATHILCPLPPSVGLGAAIRDRLRKAAMPH